MKRRIMLAALMAVLGSVCCFGAKKTTINVKVAFSDGEKLLPWPFKEAKVSSTVKAPTSPGEEFTLTDKNGYAFRFMAEKGLTVNTKSGLGVNVSEGDYIELPNIPGMALTNVTLVCGRSCNMAKPEITTADGATVKGGERLSGAFNVGDRLEWNLEGVKPDTQCRISAGGAALMCMLEIQLSYTGTMKKVKAPKVRSRYKTITLEFKDPDTGKGSWPFTTKKHQYGAAVTDADMVTENLEEFSVKCSDKAYLLSNGAYTFGKAKYSYLMLPSFTTKALVKVEMTAPKSGKQSNPAIMNQYNWKIVGGGEAAAGFTEGTPYVWELSDTQPGERYRIVLTTDGGCSIEKLVLYYE